MRNEENKSEKQFKCKFCPRTFSRTQDRGIHQNRCPKNRDRIIDIRICKDIGWVVKLYFDEKKPSGEVAKLYNERFNDNVTFGTILNFLVRAGYTPRKSSDPIYMKAHGDAIRNSAKFQAKMKDPEFLRKRRDAMLKAKKIKKIKKEVKNCE